MDPVPMVRILYKSWQPLHHWLLSMLCAVGPLEARPRPIPNTHRPQMKRRAGTDSRHGGAHGPLGKPDT